MRDFKLILIGFVVGFCLFGAIAETQIIKHHAAHYDKQGNFRWNDQP